MLKVGEDYFGPDQSNAGTLEQATAIVDKNNHPFVIRLDLNLDGTRQTRLYTPPSISQLLISTSEYHWMDEVQGPTTASVVCENYHYDVVFRDKMLYDRALIGDIIFEPTYRVTLEPKNDGVQIILHKIYQAEEYQLVVSNLK
jgi:hypothetical protein